MTARRLWATINELTEEELRLQVVIPVLRATPDVDNVTDVHGQNERGLDIIFFIRTEIERLCYGLQLKQGNISGGGTGNRTVKQIVDQLELANDFEHPVATTTHGEFRIDRFIVATSGTISSTARDEIARRLKSIPVKFWDGHEIIRRIHRYMPELFFVSDAASASYITKVQARYDTLDSLDQIPGVARRTLTEVFEEPRLRRIFDPSLSESEKGVAAITAIPALSMLGEKGNAVIIADQDGGKTSILRMLALKQVRGILAGESKSVALPVIVRAKDMLYSGLSAVDAISQQFRSLGEDELAATATDDLAAGNYYVAFDGFSELVREEEKERFAGLVEQFAEQFPYVRVLVTGRPADFLILRYFKAFYHYRIEDFDEKQSASLVRRWTRGSERYTDVAEKMVTRLREALQLPGSPIPATIGVMLHEEEGRYITNTAEAINRYMVIRLGRYAHELGMKSEVDWARKQDLLSEVAFSMVEKGQDSIAVAEFVDAIAAIQVRQGDQPRAQVVMTELVDSGVLAQEGDRLSFFRTSFRDFFAGHHLFQTGKLDDFARDMLFDQRWGGALVFAAGLRRSNSSLLSSISGTVARRKSGSVSDSLPNEYYYGAYLCGRVLANSESADHGPKTEALRTTIAGVKDSLPELSREAVDQYGNIGRLMALMAADTSVFVTVGVPWLRRQLLSLLDEAGLSDEERLFVASAYTNLGFDDCYAVLEKTIEGTQSTQVLVTLQVILMQLAQSRSVSGEEKQALGRLEHALGKRLASRKAEVQSLWSVKSEVLKFERERIRRRRNQELRERGGE